MKKGGGTGPMIPWQPATLYGANSCPEKGKIREEIRTYLNSNPFL